MSLWELLIIAVGLSMDAFAVSICKGFSMKKMSWKNALIAGLYFGRFPGGNAVNRLSAGHPVQGSYHQY